MNENMLSLEVVRHWMNILLMMETVVCLLNVYPMMVSW